MNICFRSGCDHVLEPRDFPFSFFSFFLLSFFSTRSLNRCSNDAECMRARARKVAHGNIVFLYSLYGCRIVEICAYLFVEYLDDHQRLRGRLRNSNLQIIIFSQLYISIFDECILYVYIYIYLCSFQHIDRTLISNRVEFLINYIYYYGSFNF